MKRWYGSVFGITGLLFFILGLLFHQNTILLAIFISAGVLSLLNALVMVLFIENKVKHIVHLSERINELENVLSRKKSVEEKLIQTMPTGIMIINETFDIQWANDQAKLIFENALDNRNLAMIHNPLKAVLENDDAQHPLIMKIYEHHYEIVYEKLERIIYLYKVSEREEIKRKYHEETDVVGVVHLDNLEDALSVLDVQERTEIMAKLLGALDDWADETGFFLVPETASRIFLFLQRRNLHVLMDNQFNILDQIAQISKEHDLLVTMSGGFACANLPLNQLGELAEEALNLALSRGGDQIVINLPGTPLKYFGGNTNTQEKRTRISSRINTKKLTMLMEEAETVLIMPHSHPDSDAIGAAIGILKMAHALKKEAVIVLDFNSLDKTVKKIMQLMEYEYVSFLDYFISTQEALDLAHRNSLLVLVDHHSYGQVIEPKLLQKIPNKVIIDHHRKLNDAIEETRLSYIEPYASSSTELVVEMIHGSDIDITINPFEATIMLTGIMVDTNNFTYRTGSRTFEAAAVLRKYGADTHKVKIILRESLKDIQTKSKLLTLAEVIKKRFSLVTVPDSIPCDRILLAQIADDLLEIDNTVAAFTIGRLNTQTIGISARSLEGFNVQIIMEKFGGGGHMNNAGAQIETIDIDKVKTELVHYLENAVQEEKPMKVILIKDLKNKGRKDDVIEVAAGYGNYLLTSKQAIDATTENLAIIEAEKDRQKEQQKVEREAMKVLKDRINNRAVKVYVRIGDSGKFFGKINTKQIADALLEQHGIDIDKRKIHFDPSISTLGSYSVEVKLHREVTATFELQVLEA